MCESSTAVVAEAQLPGAPPARTARLILDLGCTSAEATALARNLATGVLGRLETLLADPGPDLPAGRADRETGHRHDPGHAAGPCLA